MMCLQRVSIAATALLIAALVPHVIVAQVVDRVRLTAGGTETGEIESMTETTVQLKQGSGKKTIPVNEIQTIQFHQEPIELTQARSEIRNGAYREALATLAKLAAANVTRADIRQDVEFYSALAKARLALGSREEQELLDAGRAMNDFVVNPNARSNYHYYEGVQLLGDILAAMGRFDQAQARYATLASTPWPDFKIRAGVLEGRALAAQGRHQEAVQRFDAALAIESNAPGAAEHRLSALLGKAQCQAELGGAEEAIQAVEQVIVQAEPEALELQARAHNALGQCHLKGGDQKEALYAFLYVDVLCSSVADAHSEALFHLIPLYRSVGRDEDARQSRERLLDRYPNSVWTKKLVEPGSAE